MQEDEYVYDEASGEWLPASELAKREQGAAQVEVRDAVGNLLAVVLHGGQDEKCEPSALQAPWLRGGERDAYFNTYLIDT